MNKTELIEKIKTLYPYYTRVNSMKKSELLQLYNKNCANIPLVNNKNSCYMDSLFVALFIGDSDKKIFNLLTSTPTDNPIVITIKQQLLKIYNIITGKVYRETICSRLRHNINKFFIEYNRDKLNVEVVDWKHGQVDPTFLLECLEKIFNTPNMLREKISTYGSHTKKIAVKNLIVGNVDDHTTSCIHNITSDNLIGKKTLLLKSIFPKRKEVAHLDKTNLYRLGGINVPTKVVQVNVLSSPLVYVNIDRVVYGMNKLTTEIIPFRKLKLINNNLPIYLKSIIIHYGSKSGGHYVCAFECKNNWYLYDDLHDDIQNIGTFEDLLTRSDLLRNTKAFIYY